MTSTEIPHLTDDDPQVGSSGDHASEQTNLTAKSGPKSAAKPATSFNSLNTMSERYLWAKERYLVGTFWVPVKFMEPWEGDSDGKYMGQRPIDNTAVKALVRSFMTFWDPMTHPLVGVANFDTDILEADRKKARNHDEKDLIPSLPALKSGQMVYNISGGHRKEALIVYMCKILTKELKRPAYREEALADKRCSWPVRLLSKGAHTYRMPKKKYNKN